MIFDKEIFERMDLDRISAFILDGAADSKRIVSYEESLKEGADPINQRLERLYADRNELNEAVADLYKALNAHEAVYMELGMKAGARLLYELLLEDDSNLPPLTKETKGSSSGQAVPST